MIQYTDTIVKIKRKPHPTIVDAKVEIAPKTENKTKKKIQKETKSIMIDDIIVIDNVIPSYKQNQIEDLFVSSKLPWIFFKDIALPPSEIKRLGITQLTPGIACYIKQDNPKFINDNLLKEVKIITDEACKNIGKECKEIYNARSFMHFPLASELRKEYDNIHIDVGYEHLVCLYYVNDSDGDTFLFNRTKKRGSRL